MKNGFLALLAMCFVVACGTDTSNLPTTTSLPPPPNDSLSEAAVEEPELTAENSAWMDGTIDIAHNIDDPAVMEFGWNNSTSAQIRLTVRRRADAAMIFLNIDGGLDSLQPGFYEFERGALPDYDFDVDGNGCVGRFAGAWDYDQPMDHIELLVTEQDDGRHVDYYIRWNAYRDHLQDEVSGHFNLD